jgi:hypothetical protein
MAASQIVQKKGAIASSHVKPGVDHGAVYDRDVAPFSMDNASVRNLCEHDSSSLMDHDPARLL